EASRNTPSRPSPASRWAKRNSGSSNGNGSPSWTSSASSPNAHNGRPTPANTSSSRTQWRRRNEAPKRASSRTLRAASAGVFGDGLAGAEVRFDITIDDGNEVAGDAIAPQGDGLFTIHEDRRRRRLAGPRQRDADVGVALLARAVDHAAHHRECQVLRAGMGHPPLGHLRAHMLLHPLGQLLEELGDGAAAARP